MRKIFNFTLILFTACLLEGQVLINQFNSFHPNNTLGSLSSNGLNFVMFSPTQSDLEIYSLESGQVRLDQRIKINLINEQPIKINFFESDLVAVYLRNVSDSYQNGDIGRILIFYNDHNEWRKIYEFQEWFGINTKSTPTISFDKVNNRIAITKSLEESESGPIFIQLYDIKENNLFLNSSIDLNSQYFYDSNLSFSKNGETLFISVITKDESSSFLSSEILVYKLDTLNASWHEISKIVEGNYTGFARTCYPNETADELLVQHTSESEDSVDKIYHFIKNSEEWKLNDSIIVNSYFDMLNFSKIHLLSEFSASNNLEYLSFVARNTNSSDTVSAVFYLAKNYTSGEYDMKHKFYHILDSDNSRIGGGQVELSSTGQYLFFSDINQNLLIYDMFEYINSPEGEAKKVEITLFPNPSYGLIKIEQRGSDIGESIVIYKPSGEKVFISDFTHQLDLTFLTPGIYFLTIEYSSGYTITNKIIISN